MASAPNPPPRRRRPRYRGTHPRRFEERYKELNPSKYHNLHEHVRRQGRTPAGTHVPILLREVLERLNPGPGQTVCDCTVGFGGHAEALARRITPGGRLVGFDVDAEQLERTRQRLLGLGLDIEIDLHRGNFAGIDRSGMMYDAVLADLGPSSMQLDDPARGFSYKHDGPLDMRMDSRIARRAADLVARLSQAELAEALREWGDEPQAEAIAAAIVAQRTAQPITRTSELAALVSRVVGDARSAGGALRCEPGGGRGGVPARDRARPPASRRSSDEAQAAVARVFQAVRILVNDELRALRNLLRVLPGCLNSGGRVAILTFHSGEDRLVKHALRAGRESGAFSAVADEPIRPGPEEIRSNPRSRSAKLRWAVRA